MIISAYNNNKTIIWYFQKNFNMRNLATSYTNNHHSLYRLLRNKQIVHVFSFAVMQDIFWWLEMDS